MTTLDYYARLHLDLLIEQQMFNPNTDKSLSTLSQDDREFYESEKMTDTFQTVVQLEKDAANIEVVPDTMAGGAKFMYLRVLSDGLAQAPVDGTIRVSITQAGTDQVFDGKLFMLMDNDSLITSIKITNNEDDSTGVTLPVLVILGGESS